MLFELSNILTSFQGYFNKILTKKIDLFIIVYLDNNLFYTKDPVQTHVDAIWYVFKELQKYKLFINLKICRFHKDEIRFLRYVVLTQEIKIEDKRIEEVRNRPNLKSVKSIQVFLSFANFYW